MNQRHTSFFCSPLFGSCDSTFWLLVSTFHILVSTFCLELSTFHFLLSTHSPLFSIRECFSVILQRNREIIDILQRSFADAEKLSRLGIAIKQVCCSALGSALFDLLVQCVARIRFLVFNNLKVAEKAVT